MRDAAPTPAQSDDELFEEVGSAISGLRRRTTSKRGDLTRNMILNIVAEGSGIVTVGEVATQMGVSQPVASRGIAGCIDAGLVRRVASQADGRRSVLELTEDGEVERRRFGHEQRDIFKEITAEWEAGDRTAFATFLIRYSADARDWSLRQRDVN